MTEEQEFGEQLLCCVLKEIPQTTAVSHHAKGWSLLLLAAGSSQCECAPVFTLKPCWCTENINPM